MSYFTYQSKEIYYSEAGEGKLVVLLHGDAVSSKMFEYLLPLYQACYHVILIDFLGGGQSERVEQLPDDLWCSQSEQVIVLLEHLNCGKVSLIGTSGGAWVALNAALQRPDLIEKVVADSFDGRTLAEGFKDSLLQERSYAKSDELSRQFFAWCHGEDWEHVVDLNTKALLKCASSQTPLFYDSLDNLKVPVLFLGSLKDQMCRKDMVEEYHEMMKLIKNSSIHMFEKGDHPAIASNANTAVIIIKDFLAK